MRFRHARGNDSPAITGVHPHFRSEVSDDGTFEVPDRVLPDVRDKLMELGHEPVEAESPEPKAPEEPDLTQFSEEDLVTMDYRELQSIASGFEDIQGNWPSGKLEEALIVKHREQVDG